MDERFKPTLLSSIVVAVGVIILGVMLLSKSNQSLTQSVQTQPTSIPVQSSTNNQTREQTKTITVEGGNFYFKPNEIRVKKGDSVKIAFNNVAGFHDFVIDEFGAATQVISAGKTDEVTFTANKAGTFEFYCSVGNHRQLGMRGNLIVE